MKKKKKKKEKKKICTTVLYCTLNSIQPQDHRWITFGYIMDTAVDSVKPLFVRKKKKKKKKKKKISYRT